MAMAQATSDFPVPSDLEGFWQWDKMHGPRPLTPMSQEMTFMPGIDGFTNAMHEFGAPVGFSARFVNYYGYMAVAPLDIGDETMEARLKRYGDALKRDVPRVGINWETQWLPSILPGLEKARSLDYGALSDTALLDTLEELRADFLHRMTVHGRINFVTISASWFADFYNEHFQPENPTEPYEALQGFLTRSVDAGRGLWRLSRAIKASSVLQTAFNEVEVSELEAALETSDEGRAFLKQFRSYLDEFGWRSEAFELADPTWREHPFVPLNLLQGYMRVSDDEDPDVLYQRAVETREGLLARARDRLASDSEKLARFNELYEAARYYLPVTEDHNFYIDQVGSTVLRLPILELGRRLVRAGAAEQEDDVFLLFLSEIRDGLKGKDQRSPIAQRRAEMDRWGKVVPPPALGEPPEPTGDPFEEAMIKMFGLPPEPSRDPDLITGIGASPGIVQGRAKVVRRLDEASKLQPGDIMVCEMTMPPWTPLFATVSGLVADTGGVLSHCAIVAREYHLPCVVGTAVGTNVITDGMLLTVDGSKGIVRIDSRS